MVNIRLRFTQAVAVSILLIGSFSSFATSGFDVLRAVSWATKNKNYSGDLTYEYDGKLETLRIEHWVDSGSEFEKVMHLSGPARSLSRSINLDACGSLGNALFLGASLPLMNGKNANLSNEYKFVLVGTERVAGRESEVVQLIPNDIHRYGLLLSIDKQSKLLTKAIVLEGVNKVLERIQFINIDIENDQVTKAVSQGQNDCVIQLVESKSPIKPAWVPSGFLLARYEYSSTLGHIETYTDGLATFSILLSPNVVNASQAIAQKGATVSVLKKIQATNESLVVSVVGEIPMATAQRVTQSIIPSAIVSR